MERQASFLRCSKLNCYAEFNKMVQALSVHSRAIPAHSGTALKQPDKGTGAEYNFYLTLNIMLQQVLSNPDQNAQKSELKMIYQWFSLNKPLAPQKIKLNARRPKLVQSSRRTALLSTRPQTAPAALYGNYSSRSKTPMCPPSTPALSSFASSYMTRLIKPQPPDLVIQPASSINNRPATQPLPVRKDWVIDVAHAQMDSNGGQTVGRPTTTTASTVSNALVDSPSLLNGLTAGSVLDNATSVAAQMTMDRIMTKMDTSSVVFDGVTKNQTETATSIPQPINPSDIPFTDHDIMKKHSSSKPRSRTPSMERSASTTILETINEDDDDEPKHSMTMTIKPIQADKEARQHEEEQKQVEDASKMNKDMSKTDSTHQVNSETDITVQVPKVTISNVKSKLSSRASSTSSSSYRGRLPPRTAPVAGEQSKTVCHVQVINLNLTSTTGSERDSHTNRRTTTRVPRKLVPIVAGFNQYHYRPRTVDVCTTRY